MASKSIERQQNDAIRNYELDLTDADNEIRNNNIQIEELTIHNQKQSSTIRAMQDEINNFKRQMDRMKMLHQDELNKTK